MDQITRNDEVRKTQKMINVFIGIVSVIGAMAHFFFAYKSSISVAQQRVFHTFLFILVFSSSIKTI